MALSIGDTVTPFSLPADDGAAFSEADLVGKRTILYFYPKDDTPSCTNEAQSFRDIIQAFQEAGVSVGEPWSRVHLGDIIVSMERARAQAEAGRGGQTGDVRWTAAEELRLLVTHGALHLCGYDQAAPDEEAAMRTVERRLLGIELPA